MTIIDLLSFIEAELFIPELPAGDKAATLKVMVEHLKERGRISSDKVVLNALLTRENMGSTGIGKGTTSICRCAAGWWRRCATRPCARSCSRRPTSTSSSRSWSRLLRNEYATREDSDAAGPGFDDPRSG